MTQDRQSMSDPSTYARGVDARASDVLERLIERMRDVVQGVDECSIEVEEERARRLMRMLLSASHAPIIHEIG